MSLDFVGYSVGSPAAPAAPTGFFGFFDGTGIPVGLLAGGVAARHTSYPRREQKRRWFDPALARAIEQQGKDKEARRLELNAAMAAAIERLHRIGKSVPALARKFDETVKPFKTNKRRVVLPPVPAPTTAPEQIRLDARELGRQIAREMDLDLQAMTKSLETVAAIDDLLEWAEEEEVVLILLAQL